MKKVLCLVGALTVLLSLAGCQKIQARNEIKAANDAYQKEDYGVALQHYVRARKIDPSFPELDRMIGYSQIGLYVPDEKSPANESHADAAIAEPISYRDMKGHPWVSPVWQIVLHVVNHGTHHRGQVAGFLRSMGKTPPVLDLIAYYRSR